jgi:hypothetical protein
MSVLFPGLDPASRMERALRGTKVGGAKVSSNVAAAAAVEAASSSRASPYTDFTSSFGFAPASATDNGNEEEGDHNVSARPPTFITSPSEHKRRVRYPSASSTHISYHIIYQIFILV